MSSSKPKSITLRQYQVGFGDCFLLSFNYPRESRHILIDFGSNKLPKSAGNGHMATVARQIQKDCGGKLHVVVATHRHKDHISGFATNRARKAPGDIIASCQPELVIQPWTEDPSLDQSAQGPAASPSRHFRAALAEMQRFAKSVSKSAGMLAKSRSPRIRELRFKGENGLTNKPAVKNLMSMGKTNLYVSCGDNVNLTSLLPGVKITVLGPPTLKQVETLSYAPTSSEYWLGVKKAWVAQVGSFGSPGRVVAAKKIPPEARWFVSAADRTHMEESLELVRTLDDFLNNTSVILLFEACGKKLLFPGDAQLENWSYSLIKRKNTYAKLLRDTDLYKVGHHGSRNATPKSLWELFSKRSKEQAKTRLQTVLSTMKGVYDKDHEVPRKALVERLTAESTLHDSQTIKGIETKDPVLL